jgi:hypothetical protein
MIWKVPKLAVYPSPVLRSPCSAIHLPHAHTRNHMRASLWTCLPAFVVFISSTRSSPCISSGSLCSPWPAPFLPIRIRVTRVTSFVDAADLLATLILAVRYPLLLPVTTVRPTACAALLLSKVFAASSLPIHTSVHTSHRSADLSLYLHPAFTSSPCPASHHSVHLAASEPLLT